MGDIGQALAGLQVFAGGEELQVQRDVVRQLFDADGKTGLFVLGHHVDHGLTAIAGLTVHVFEQQQRQRATAAEQGTVVLLAIHQVVFADQFEQLVQRIALLRADFATGGNRLIQLITTVQQDLGRIIQ